VDEEILDAMRFGEEPGDAIQAQRSEVKGVNSNAPAKLDGIRAECDSGLGAALDSVGTEARPRLRTIEGGEVTRANPNAVESRIRPKGGFGLTPGKLVTLLE